MRLASIALVVALIVIFVVVAWSASVPI